MTSRKKSQASKVQLGELDLGVRAAQRVRAKLAAAARSEYASVTAARRELNRLAKQHKSALTQILGRSGMRELDSIREGSSGRARRKRAVNQFFRDKGDLRGKVDSVGKDYLAQTRGLLDAVRDRFPILPPLPGLCQTPWVTYEAPFSGYEWSYYWSKTSNVSTPVLNRYLDTATGHIGSSVDLRDNDAGDDDKAELEYYTGLNVWHVPQGNGPLEVYVAFEFNDSSYSGKVRDELGFSDSTYTHWGAARMKAADTVGRLEIQDSPIFNYINVAWGDDDDWDRQAATPRDMHWYYFKTSFTFDQGTPVLLEGGVRHVAWFTANDESVRLTSDLDLRLDRIMVRSCDWDPIP